MTAPNLFIAQTSPAGPTVGFGLAGDAKLTRGSGTGGWQVVDRPRRVASTEWVDGSPFTMSLDLIIDGYAGGIGSSVEAQCATVEGWELAAPGTSPPQPATLAVSGPVPRTDLAWVAQAVVWNTAIRDPASGVRWQQQLTITLLQYVPPVLTVQAVSPAAAAAVSLGAGAASPPPAGTYTVRAGDTLDSIAGAQLGSWTQWQAIATLNNIRDPNSISVGQVLQMPAPNTTTSGGASGSVGAQPIKGGF